MKIIFCTSISSLEIFDLLGQHPVVMLDAFLREVADVVGIDLFNLKLQLQKAY